MSAHTEPHWRNCWVEAAAPQAVVVPARTQAPLRQVVPRGQTMWLLPQSMLVVPAWARAACGAACSRARAGRRAGRQRN